MKTGMNATVIAQVKKFESLWDDSLENRYKAAQLYYKTLSNNPDPAVRRMFHENSSHKDWTAIRWRWLYYIGKGVVSKRFLDVHNYSLALCCRQIPVSRQDDFCENGLRLYSKEHKGGVVVPLRKLNAKHIHHVFDIDNGKEYPVATQRKKSLYGASSKEPLVFAEDTKNKVLIKAVRKCTIDAGTMSNLLTYKNDSGNSILTPAQLREIADRLETTNV